jgi:hypothetical protein
MPRKMSDDCGGDFDATIENISRHLQDASSLLDFLHLLEEEKCAGSPLSQRLSELASKTDQILSHVSLLRK